MSLDIYWQNTIPKLEFSLPRKQRALIPRDYVFIFVVVYGFSMATKYITTE